MATAANQLIVKRKFPEMERSVGFSAEGLRAPFFLRCAALCIDYMVLLAIPIGWLIVSKLFSENAASVSIGNTVWVLAFILFLANYFALPLFRGQTIGKMLFGLTIVDADGTNLDLSDILRRHVLGYFVTVLTLGIGFLISAVNSSGRSLHDFIAGTIVIRGRKM